MKLTQETRYCKACEEELRGRKDKQYCSDYCRAQYYNQAHADALHFMRRVNQTIRRNRHILARLQPTARHRIPRSRLLEAGLNFDYITNIYRTRTGKVYYFCYDYGYTELDGGYVAIVLRGDYVD